jgi:hypothetical protein
MNIDHNVAEPASRNGCADFDLSRFAPKEKARLAV